MVVEMQAVRTFSSGAEGFYKKGERFIVPTNKRVKELKMAGLAKIINEDVVQEPDEVIPPREGEAWGIVSMGGGWYRIPNGEKVEGFDEAKFAFLKYLQTELSPRIESESLGNEEVRLIPSETEPDFIDFEEEDQPPFEEVVKHVGGGWYELPNGERINGRDSAKEVYERGENNDAKV